MWRIFYTYPHYLGRLVNAQSFYLAGSSVAIVQFDQVVIVYFVQLGFQIHMNI